WLRDISGHTRVQAALAVAVHGVRRHGDDGKRFPARVSADDPRRLQTVEHRHLDVHQYQIVLAALQLRYGFAAVVRQIESESPLAQDCGYHLLVYLVVFHDEDSSGLRWRRRRADHDRVL